MTGAPSTRTAIAGQPLAGWRVLITRATRQSGGLAGPLRDLGAEVLEIPTIRIDPPASFAPLDEVLRNIRDYDWLLLTSVNGVEALFERLEKLALSKDRLRHLQVAAIGPATRRAIEERGLSVAMTPPKYVAEAVADMLRDPTRGKRVLLVRAKVARDVLPIELRKSGALVDVIEAYETKVPEGAEQRLREIFSGPRAKPDVVTFTSSSTANNFLALLGDRPENLLRGVYLASIGPVTTATLKQAGFIPAIEAREYTMKGLVQAIVEKRRLSGESEQT